MYSPYNVEYKALCDTVTAFDVQEVCYPPSILDLMVICWSRDPADRPSANEVVSYASRAEFCSLLASVAIGDGLETVCACSFTASSSDVITPHSSATGKCYTDTLCLSVSDVRQTDVRQHHRLLGAGHTK